MGKTNFTKRSIENLPAKDARYNVFDSQTRGLGVVVHPSGTKTFFHLKKVQGWPQRLTLGAFPDMSVEAARGKAAEVNGKLSKWKSNDYEGANPVERPKKVSTLGEVLEHYCAKHLATEAKNPDRAVKGVQWQFSKYLGSWRNRQLGTISRAQVRELHAAISKEHGGHTANRTLQLLRALFNHAIHPDIDLWNGTNPCAKPNKFMAVENGRERTIKPEEAQAFFRELENEKHADLRDIILIALATGARRGTILAMRWEQLDFANATWTIPQPKGKKNVKPLTVPLTRFAVSVIKNRPPTSDEWVFPGRRGHITTVEDPWRSFLARTGIKNLRFHDLRRTIATAEGDTGASTEAIQKTLGHVESSTATAIYDRSERRDEVREAMEVAMEWLLSTGKMPARKLLAANGDGNAAR